MTRRHRLDASAASPEAVTDALLALHATDPASVYLSVLARSADTTLGDVADAMYERRSLVRWMAMRRTLFVVSVEDVPVVQAAASAPLARVLRARLISQLERNNTDPVIVGDTGAWLADLEGRVLVVLRQLGSATGTQLSEAEPALRTAIVPRAPSDRPQNVTSALLTLMSAQGDIVRGSASGAWTSRQHRWEPVARWWPDGLPDLRTAAAQSELARRWLQRFGPATVEDLRWWTGWNLSTTREALSRLPVETVDLHGEPGIALEDSDKLDEEAPPVATLLPALDPTPMGYKRRGWFMGVDPALVFDRSGNIGPTVWWDGEIIGSWACAPDGEIRTAIIADRGAAAAAAVREAATILQQRLEGAVVVPAVRTPLEAELREG